MAQGKFGLSGLSCPISVLGVTLVCFQGRGPFIPSLSHLPVGGVGHLWGWRPSFAVRPRVCQADALSILPWPFRKGI